MFKNKEDEYTLYKLINYQFKNPASLAQALTTKSAINNRLQSQLIGHHENMAFLGDGILRMVIDEFLMETFPYYGRDNFSPLRDQVVNNRNLCQAARGLQLDQYMLMDANQTSSCQNGQPKLLADAMEAIIYAIYIDSGKQLDEVRCFILQRSGIYKALERVHEQEQEKYAPLIAAINAVDMHAVDEYLRQWRPVNFLFRQQAKHVNSDGFTRLNISIVEVVVTPLEVAIEQLKQCAMAGKDTTVCLEIIEKLLKRRANVNLKAKDRDPIITKLFLPINREGLVVDSNALQILQQHQHKPEIQQLAKDMEVLRQKEVIPEWESVTDKVVVLYCQHGAGVSVVDTNNGNALLGLAIIHQQRQKFKTLLSYAVDLTHENLEGNSPLHLSATVSIEYVKALLEKGANPHQENHAGKKPFDIAHDKQIKQCLLVAELRVRKIASNNTEVSTKELSEQAVVHYQKGQNGQSPKDLAIAVKLFRQLLTMQLAQDYKASNIIAAFYNLGSALYQQYRFARAKPILKRACVLHEYESGQTSEDSKFHQRLRHCQRYLEYLDLHSDRSHTVTDLFKMKTPILATEEIKRLQENLKNNACLNSHLFEAVKQHSKSELQHILEEGAAIDEVSQTGEPILHYAIRIYANTQLMAEATDDLPHPEVHFGNMPEQAYEVIVALLDYGASPNQCNTQRQTALHLAAKLNLADIVTLLLKHNADPMRIDAKKCFASDYAEDMQLRSFILSSEKLNTANYIVDEQKEISNEYTAKY